MFNANDLPLRRRTWLNIAGIPRHRQGWELSDCTEVTPEILDEIDSWLDSAIEGKIIRATGKTACGLGLMLYGEPGHGKTTVSLVILQEIIRKFPLAAFDPMKDHTIVRPAYFITFSSLLELKGSMMDDPTPEQVTLLEGIMGECLMDSYNVRVLVIDDVGKEHTSGTGWQRAFLHHVLRSRFNAGLPTIVTSNIDPKAWGAAYGDAAESFTREAFHPIALKSPKGDLRK